MLSEVTGRDPGLGRTLRFRPCTIAPVLGGCRLWGGRSRYVCCLMSANNPWL